MFVDDDGQITPRQLSEALDIGEHAIRVRHPEEVIADDLEWSEVVVVDYFLSHWPERDEIESVARRPLDGLAVAASMRSALLPPLGERSHNLSPTRPVAFALLSANLDEATLGLPPIVLPHVFARQNGLEWAFRREDLTSSSAGRQLALLATAIKRLPERWPADEAILLLWDLLGLNAEGDRWVAEAEAEVLNCRPPLHELSEHSHGIVLLRWLLHRILPYPCFLLDEQQLCARLRIDRLRDGGSANEPLTATLAAYEYRGALAGFLGSRWWRAGIESWLFEVTDGDPGNAATITELALRQGARVDTAWIQPVIIIDSELRRKERFVEVSETVRVRPDDWPPYADNAFVLRSDAESDGYLRSLVDPIDVPSLDEQGEDPTP